MIYGSASLMGIPWEILIKQFRKQLGSTPFDHLIEYRDQIIYKGDTYVIDTVPQVHYRLGVVQYRNATMTKVT